MNRNITPVLLSVCLLILLPLSEVAIGQTLPGNVSSAGDTTTTSLSSDSNTISNANIQITVSNGEFGRPGQLSSFRYKTASGEWVELIEEGLFLGLQAGETFPAPGTITKTSNTSITFHSDSFPGTEPVPIESTVTYTLKGNQLWVDFTLTFSDEVLLDYGLECDINCSPFYDVQSYTNQSMDGKFSPLSSDGDDKFFLNQLIFLAGEDVSLMIVQPNPYHSTFATFPNKYLTFMFIDSEEPIYDLPGPRLASLMAPGQTLRRTLCLIPTELDFNPWQFYNFNDSPLVYLSPHKAGYDSSLIFIWDELPVIYTPEDDPWSFSEDEDDTENYWISEMIKQLNKYPRLKFSWLILPDGIGPFEVDSVYFEDGSHDWWMTHADHRLLDFATEEYIDWLQKIRDNYYPWAKQVELGNHGYHHTPNLRELLKHEFIYFDEFRDSNMIAKIVSDMDALGLNCSVHAVRFPGFKYTRSTLWAILDNDFIFLDNGKRLDEFYMSFYYKDGKTISSVNTCWWSDYHPDTDWGRPFSMIGQQLDKHKIALLGGHPVETFYEDSPEAYQRFDEMMGRIFNEYPHAIFCGAREMGAFMIAVNEIDRIRYQISGGYLEVNLNGAVPQDTTLIIHLPDNMFITSNTIVIDGSIMTVSLTKKNDFLVYIILPAISEGAHTIQIPISTVSIPSTTNISVKLFPNPINSTQQLHAIVNCRTTITNCSTKVYDIAGNLIMEIDNSHFTALSDTTRTLAFNLLGPGSNLANGVYLLHFSVQTACGELLHKVEKLAVLK